MTDSAPLPTPDRAKPTPAWVWWLAAALILAQAVLSWTATLSKSMTVDEIAHLTGGVALWHGDQRLVPENGNLPQRIGTLPAVLMGARLPAPDDPTQTAADVWRIGNKAWFYTPGQDHWPMLSAGRAAMTVFLMGVGAMVFWWARRWWGDLAGLVALGVAVLSPTALAHGALITSDMAAALLLPLSAGLFWWHLHRDAWWSLALASLAVGLACVAKFSAVLLVPTFLLLDVLWLWRGRKTSLPKSLVALARDHAVIILAVMALIWSFHGWRYQPIPPGSGLPNRYYQPWDVALPESHATRSALLEACRDWKIFPEAYTYGAAYMTFASDMRLAFFNGQLGTTGWRMFFPTAFAIKTPLALLALAALGAGAIIAGWKRQSSRAKAGLYRAAPLLIWTAIYCAVVINSHLNLGQRHLLPIYPGLFILCGAVVLLESRWCLWLVGGLLAALTFASFQIRPHYLAYFNELVGGPQNGYKHLVDSSLDWGQDLPGLADWLRDNNPDHEPVYLSYFGVSNPAYHGVQARQICSLSFVVRSAPWENLRGGYYAFGASMLQLHCYGHWDAHREYKYRILRRRVQKLLATPPTTRDEQTKLSDLLMQTDKERMSRLCQILRESEPVAMVGYSILIYHLTDEEARQADFPGIATQAAPDTTIAP